MQGAYQEVAVKDEQGEDKQKEQVSGIKKRPEARAPLDLTGRPVVGGCVWVYVPA
ncbi:hypothetical protein [Gelria sp. Kuro-4]|uniref:hypothetical protein n=1 Tax=Gelria sp. Kuro-4 TaxID=2796927 RepID=UPI001BEFA004|nr:hypothetical protein [Gelria sp. Kuro-4]BCV23512.1 hypothetical protein kuro4_02850 [Gelria sp. Kuro-4]